MEVDPNVVCSKSFVLSAQNYFCYCLSLINGVQIITVLAIVFGVTFTVLASLLGNWDFPERIEIVCHITGVLFYIWFLTLLLVLSLDLKLPKMLTVWIAIALSIWLFLVLGFFIVSLIRWSTHRNMILYNITMVTCFVADVFAMYSVWVLKSYFHSLLSQHMEPRITVASSTFAQMEGSRDSDVYVLNTLLSLPQLRDSNLSLNNKQSAMRYHEARRIAEVIKKIEESGKARNTEVEK